MPTKSQKSAKQGADGRGRQPEAGRRTSHGVLTRESSLVEIRKLADRNPQMVFTSLAHRMDVDLLRQSFRRLSKNKACGVDKVTATQYARRLMENLSDLHQRLRHGQYRALPVKRVWIDKEDGGKRPIGIPALEDKIVQRAVATLLETVYEAKFHAFSHGFRRGHSPHHAIDDLRKQCRAVNVGWIVSADIRGLFDNIDRKLLISIIRQRVNDGGLLRLIGKWLRAGVMEGEVTTYPDRGTPQGGVISPVLSNIFLHHVLDDWYVEQVKPRLRGRSVLIRWADDFIVGFECEGDARRVLAVLPKRFGRFKLALHPEKTRLIAFSRPNSDKQGRERGTFDFLGFTFHWAKSLGGYWVIKETTARKRKSRFMKHLWRWCKANRHKPIQWQQKELAAKLRGFYQYFGVTGNFRALSVVHWHAYGCWVYWLRRRSSKGSVRLDHLQSCYPLSRPRIVHRYPTCRGLHSCTPSRLEPVGLRS